MTTRDAVFNSISAERHYQDKKWGTIKERPHTIAEWILIAEAELEEAKRAWTKECSDHRTIEELLQTAAVIVAALEQYSVSTSWRPKLEYDNAPARRCYDLHYAKI